MKTFNPFLDILPTLDVHGNTRDMIRAILDEFINDNIKLKNKKIVVIHGKGYGILKDEVHILLSRDSRVKSFYIDGFNIGTTVIELK